MFTVETTGTDGKIRYTTDDGSKLYINGQQIVDNDGDHDVQEREGSVRLESGKARIRLEYFNGGGGYFLFVTLGGPGIARRIISPDRVTLK